MRHSLLVLLMCSILVSTAHAQSLRVGQVNAPGVNCFYNPTCVVVVQDFTDHVLGMATERSNVLRMRTLVAAADAPLAGLYGHQYQVDLRDPGDGVPMCIDRVAIDFRGPIVPFDYTGDGVGQDVYVITRGSMGAIGPAVVQRQDNAILFRFPPPFVCTGETTFFFGFTSSEAPRLGGLPAEVSVMR